MPNQNGRNGNKASSLAQALDRMSYEYLSTNAPDLIIAIDQELRGGIDPAGIRFLVQRHVGSDRENLARRCEQAARFMAAMVEA